MNARLERILVKLAQKHAPHLLFADREQQESSRRTATLARKLANYNLLVMMGYLHTGLLSTSAAHVETWVNEYGRLYNLLTEGLFPSYTAISAQYADEQFPPIVVIQGASTPVIQVLAGFVTPYVAARQSYPYISEVEMLGLMGVVLDELEAGDLPHDRYNTLKAEGVAALKRLLDCPVRQVGLTTFDRSLVGQTRPLSAPPESLPEQDRVPRPRPAAPPAEPAPSGPEYELPRLQDDDTPTPTEQLFRVPIPVRMDTGRLKRRLPVPDLPDDDNQQQPDDRSSPG